MPSTYVGVVASLFLSQPRRLYPPNTNLIALFVFERTYSSSYVKVSSFADVSSLTLFAMILSVYWFASQTA